jgi:polyisoprenoid-binding protein YceI
MRANFRIGLVLCLFCLVGIGVARAQETEEYSVDPDHSGLGFKISHLGLSWVHGRFDDLSGRFTLDRRNPANCSFELSAKTGSVDTNNRKRDDHLRSPDFFNARQFPAITFKSTRVRPAKDGFEVTGDLTLHGVTHPVTFLLSGGKTAEFPRGVHRTGFSAELSVKRSEFGITKFAGAVGDNVYLEVSFEGTQKK